MKGLQGLGRVEQTQTIRRQHEQRQGAGLLMRHGFDETRECRDASPLFSREAAETTPGPPPACLGRKFKRLSAADGGTGALGLRALHGEVSRSIGCVIAQAGDDGCAASLTIQRRTCDGAVADFELLKKSRRHLHRLDVVAQAPRLQAQLQP